MGFNSGFKGLNFKFCLQGYIQAHIWQE